MHARARSRDLPRRNAKLRHVAIGLVAPLFWACPSSPPPESDSAEPVAERVESPGLALAVNALPDGFVVEANQGQLLELVRAEGLPEGRAWVELGEEVEGGINLVDVVNSQRAEYEALPGGSFSGNRELMLPDGRPAYYSRGRFTDGDTEVEEFRVHSLHPLQNRLLRVYYRYPAGADSAERLNDLLLLVGEIEALEGADEDSETAGGS